MYCLYSLSLDTRLLLSTENRTGEHMNHNQHNIIRVYNRANADQIRDGLNWYQSAHAECVRLADLLPDKMVYRAAGIVSAISPGLRWEVTVEAAERIIRHESLEGIGQRYAIHRRKAERIRDGSSLGKEFYGPDRDKTRNFWHLLCHPANPLAVCVDGHAYSIWFGSRIKLDQTPYLRGRLYIRIARDYITVARDLGILPCQLQAITWITHRHFHEIAPF